MNGSSAFVAAAAIALLACAGEEPARDAVKAAQPAVAPQAQAQPGQPARKAPASKRVIGRYRLRFSQIPDSQLPEQLAELKRAGKADTMARLEYTFTDTEVIMDTYGVAGRNQMRFYYEILSESGDELVLRKHGDSKGPEKVTVTVKDRGIVVTGEGESGVHLQRID